MIWDWTGEDVYLFDMLCVQQGLAAKSLYVCENHSQLVNLLHKTCSVAQQMKKKVYRHCILLWTNKSADQPLLAAEYFDRSTFWLKNPGIFRSLGNLYISRLCYTSRFSGTALNGLRTSSLEPAFGKWGHGPGTLGATQFHPYLSFSLFFFHFWF